MKLNIEIEEQEFTNGIPSIVQNLLNSLNEECKEAKTKLVEIQNELQSVKSDKTSVESEKSRMAEELSQIKLAKEVLEKDLNEKLSKANDDLSNVQKEKSGIESEKSRLAEELLQVKSAKEASEKDLNEKLSKANDDLSNVQKEKSGIETEKSKLAEELLQVKSEKEASEKDLNDKLSKANEDLANVQKEKSEIEEAKSKLAEEHSKVKEDLEKVEAEKDSLNAKLATSEQTCESLRLELLEHDFSDLLKNLSEEGKSVVNNNFGNADDFKALLFSMDKIKVEDFYSEVRERVNNQKLEDIENLKKLAHITCEYYCAGTGCQMIEPKIGQEFNEQECIEKVSTKSYGKISEVLLFGVRNEDGSVRNKAMVSIG